MYVTGFSGTIGEYEVTALGNLIQVTKDEQVIAVRVVDNFGRFTRRARALKLGLAYFDDFEVIYIYDSADDNYGYAVNLQIEEFSEWGYSPVS